MLAPSSINSRTRLAALFLAAFALSACSETQLLLHTAKRIGKSTSSPVPQGRYKVGNPYQIGSTWYYPKEDYVFDETGIASWYGPGFHGKRTANGEIYDQNALTAAHRTLPMPSLVQVTNLENGRSLRLRVNDRGPFAQGRIIDLSRRGSQLLGFHQQGTARVRVQILAAESRVLARRAKGGSVLAKADLPIRSDIDVAKPSVAAESLPPPPGANASARPGDSRVFSPQAAPERQITQALPPEGQVTMLNVKTTRLYVQAGAFTEYHNANQVKARLYGFKNVKITSARIGGREYFRVRAGPVKSVAEADRILDYVLKVGYSNARIVVD